MKNASHRLLIQEAFSYLYCANFKDMAKLTNLVGKRYGRLTVLSYIKNDRWNHRIYECRCDCGNVVNVLSRSLSSGATNSCGCLHQDLLIARNTKHGEAKTSKEYWAWHSLKKRCRDKNQRYFNNYGGRGITVCDRWLNSFENFLADMGRAPSPKHSIERKDNNGNYEPSNCHWATRIEQANNTRRNLMIEYNSKIQSLPNWCRELNLKYGNIRSRIYRYGWSIEKAFTT